VVVALTVFFSALLASSAGAQTVTGTLQGTVIDSTGAVLPGVVVTIKNIDTGASRGVVTNAVGFYTAPFLPVGPYSVTAALSGFSTLVRNNVEVGLNQTRVAAHQYHQRRSESGLKPAPPRRMP
jgi:hypothetical protein